MFRSFVRPMALLAMLELLGCAGGSAPEGESARLWWIPGDPTDDWEQARAGLWWALSNLGAAPTDESALSDVEQGEDGVRFSLDVARLGFDEDRLAVLPEAEGDLGRFLMATLYEPTVYYTLTGACSTLGEWQVARQAADPLFYAITTSLLVDGDRRVTLNPVGEGVESLAYQAEEGEGSLADGTFAVVETEVLDMLPTGQQRYAVYDADGNLAPAAAFSAAGQPGKCMWCHETTLQRGTGANEGVPGYLDYDAFIAQVEAAEAMWFPAREAIAGPVRWSEPVVHEWAERLTLSFLEPSAERVAREWGVSVAEVAAEGLPTHTNEEFPEWGELYDRADVDAARSDREPEWEPLAVPPSDRELPADWPLGDVPGCAL